MKWQIFSSKRSAWRTSYGKLLTKSKKKTIKNYNPIVDIGIIHDLAKT
jgi:hypothetical protein